MAQDNLRVESPTALSAAAARAERHSWWERNQRRVAPYLFISPFYILYLIFFAAPAVFAVILSFNEWDGADPIQWRGLSNYTNLLGDAIFQQAVVNTLWYMAVGVFIGGPLALGLALILNARFTKGKGFFRTLYFIPVVTPIVAVASMFILIFDNQYGLLNAALQKIGLPAVYWLGDPLSAKIALSVLLVWEGLGVGLIYYVAGLQGVPQDLLEAARVDGATYWQSFWNVTIPALKPVILFTTVIGIIGAAQIYSEPAILLGGGNGPGNGTISIVQYLYQQGYQNLRFGYASAMGVISFVVIFGISILQVRLFGAFRED